jgi:hypothetical protein
MIIKKNIIVPLPIIATCILMQNTKTIITTWSRHKLKATICTTQNRSNNNNKLCRTQIDTEWISSLIQLFHILTPNLQPVWQQRIWHEEENGFIGLWEEDGGVEIQKDGGSKCLKWE